MRRRRILLALVVAAVVHVLDLRTNAGGALGNLHDRLLRSMLLFGEGAEAEA